MKHVQEKNRKLMEEMGWKYRAEHMGWVMSHLMEEAGEVAHVVKHLEHPAYKRPERGKLLKELEDELCDVIGICARVANAYGLDLDAAMDRNHAKVREKFKGYKGAAV